MYFFYRILTAASLVFLVPYYILRGWRRGEPSRAWRERLGSLPSYIAPISKVDPRGEASTVADISKSGAIWIHAVSVGEVLAAKPLADMLKQRYPDRVLIVSTTTETGQRLARERLQSAREIFYFPIDSAFVVRRTLRAIRPALVIVMETEIWPNFLREARRCGVPVVFANARISEKSFARYKRWEFLVGAFFNRAMGDAAFFLAQSPEDAARLAEMGAPPDHIEVTGNLKYDSEPPAVGKFGGWLEDQVRRQERWPLIVAGSVVEEEEEAVLAAYDILQRRWRRALLVLAPRKPDRFIPAVDIAAAAGWEVSSRSQLDLSAALDENADVLVLDSIGELAGLYAFADLVFVGGSLVQSGGHNILEPAWFSKPPLFGPSMENFREMAAQFLGAQAGIQVSSAQQLASAWAHLIENDPIRERMGAAAHQISERNRGATARSLRIIAAVLETEGRLA